MPTSWEPTVKRQEISGFALSVCPYSRLSQAKTLSELVPAAMSLRRASLAELGRTMACTCGTATKHCLKRVGRFVGNYRIEPIKAMRGIVQWLAKPRRRLPVSLDWVEIRRFQCLVLTAQLRAASAAASA